MKTDLTRSRWWGLLAAVAAIAASATGAGAQETGKLTLDNCLVWGGLVRGSHEKREGLAKVPDELDNRLKEAFDYEHYQLMGEHTQPVLAEFASYVVPSEELYMKIDCKGQAEDGLALHLQLWREESVIVKTDVILRDHSPVLIAGPMWGADQLFFVVELQLENGPPVAAAGTAAPANP